MKLLPFLAAHGFPWSQAAISLVSALIGGLIAGFLTVLAQDKAIRAQRQTVQDAEAREVSGILKAIEEELSDVDGWFIDWLEKTLKDRPQQPLNITPIHQNPFTIFDANAAAIGKIADPELRQMIIRSYIRAKTLLDLVNHYSEKYTIWEQLRHGIGADTSGALSMRDELLVRMSDIERLTEGIKPTLTRALELLRKTSAK
jgi:hypothetical protein